MTKSHTPTVNTKRRSTLPPGINPRPAARSGRPRTRNGIPLVFTGRRVTRAEVAAYLVAD
jgi:hypothetical protein